MGYLKIGPDAHHFQIYTNLCHFLVRKVKVKYNLIQYNHFYGPVNLFPRVSLIMVIISRSVFTTPILSLSTCATFFPAVRICAFLLRVAVYFRSAYLAVLAHLMQVRLDQ